MGNQLSRTPPQESSGLPSGSYEVSGRTTKSRIKQSQVNDRSASKPQNHDQHAFSAQEGFRPPDGRSTLTSSNEESSQPQILVSHPAQRQSNRQESSLTPFCSISHVDVSTPLQSQTEAFNFQVRKMRQRSSRLYKILWPLAIWMIKRRQSMQGRA